MDHSLRSFIRYQLCTFKMVDLLNFPRGIFLASYPERWKGKYTVPLSGNFKVAHKHQNKMMWHLSSNFFTRFAKPKRQKHLEVVVDQWRNEKRNSQRGKQEILQEVLPISIIICFIILRSQMRLMKSWTRLSSLLGLAAVNFVLSTDISSTLSFPCPEKKEKDFTRYC